MKSQLSDSERRDWLRLARAESIGSVAFEELLGRFGSPTKVLEVLPDLARRPIDIPTPADTDCELEAGARLGARLLCAAEADYPYLLAALDYPPPVLWALGDPGVIKPTAVAIVGARVASAAGQSFANKLARDLGEAGFTVISGMARGIDGAAHQGAFATGTVAVLAGGVDEIYPREHEALYRRLAEAGCIVSECPIGYRAQARDFPRRNRIISGLSLGVIVVEAEMRSGSLITARLAGEQGREVLAVPGSPLDPRAAGCNDLIRNGAALCAGVDDVIRAVGSPRGLAEPDRDRAPRFEGEVSDTLRERLADLLSPTPVSRDELVRITGAPAAEVYAALVELSLSGRAELLPGGLVSR
ncbi:MAG TPA: DNA-processing protein DprA [Caulobacteraceae bacterium]|nr:DNA-processing protein DprA [Caulobacteraceae bacterium]